ncbi:hypothetical protein B0T20DRAFT_186839 [Sordaria brevicollis]|uniref:DUF676 domain-containing protein n=1 Tax=Sordaria brevicollis TaxID=83679 RepID=A0AAE0PFF9_SORBR|nr:hypothetical protein B0T20DRAFT_186839 [Sordaria brevicollis]
MPYVQDQSLTGAASSSSGGPSTRPSSSFHLQSPLPSIAMVDNDKQQHHRQMASEWTADQGHGLDNPSSPPANYPYSQWNRPVDPRTSSAQSLAPSTPTDQAGGYRDSRRTLLVIYIHGFMGNDSSFRSFPAHVHNFLREALVETHVIHSKIYPRYKTYKSITVARDNFSTWLLPHESPTTDVILIGHSMGGLLAAEVALMPRQPQDPVYSNSPFRHRILGTLSLDAPLLGLHPGIVVSGIASLFRKAPSPPGATNSGQGSQTLVPQQSPGLSPDPSIYSEISPPAEATSPLPGLTPPSKLASPSAADPFFNPKFFNDVSFVDRGWFKNIAHFAQKHSQENLVEAATNHIISHLEFGGCLADYPGMKSRYNRLRRLEDVDELRQDKENLVRVRFVNYYTVSTGILKEKDSRKKSAPQAVLDAAPAEGHSRSHSTSKTAEKDHNHDRESFDTARSHTSTPRSSEELELTELEPVPLSDDDEPSTQGQGHRQGRHVEAQKEQKEDKPPAYVSHEEVNKTAEPSINTNESTTELNTTTTTASSLPPPDLPPIPPTPSPPEAIDLSSLTSKEARKQAEKEFKQARKEYESAVKTQDKILKERLKIVEKHEKAQAKLTRDSQKQQEKQQKDAEKQEKKERRETEKQDKKDKKEWERRQKKEDKLRDESTANRIGELESHHLAHNNSQLSISAGGSPTPRSPGGQEGDEETTSPSNRKDKGKRKDKEPKKEKEKKQKLRKFCMTPSKNSRGILDDPTWIQVYMEGVDEVGAHCGLFFPGPHYDKLVGDVSSRIVAWVQDDLSKRMMLEGMQGVEGLELD